ncbi:MAG: dihydroneopterin aldolase [Selenomonadaceae bacterium]|nr:dihydroneopterin aldolase [Selenomonadaceae bacterium]MBP3722485.1 dihydroneopterin aldolase [Selenomonadaceae bacterium]MBR3721737.1 dihydroneopterin aldolase [Selenomonadaceae bacterium]
MAKIRIHNMMFYGFHGIYEYEREQGQKFFIDVEIEMKDEKSIASDDVKDGVDTAAVYDIVGNAVKHKRFTLLVSLSAHIGDQLLQKYPHFDAVTATIRKPSVPISGPIDYVEVETTRYQQK